MEVPPESYQCLGKQVPLTSIDKELSLLWSDRPDSTARASLLNVAVYSQRPGSLIDNQEVMSELLNEYSCRMLLVELKRDEEVPHSFAWVKGYCKNANGVKTVCNDQIAFYLTGHIRGRIPNTVFAHLDSDLPLVFWWQGEINHIFRPRLYRRMNRFIFDSSDWENPLESYQRIVEARHDSQNALIMQDLEWARSFHVRSALSMLFDEMPALYALKFLDSIRLVFNPHHRNAALLILTWIVRQLKLEFIEKTELGFSFKMLPTGRIINIILRPDKKAYLIDQLSFNLAERALMLTRDAKNAKMNISINLPNFHINRVLPADEHDTRKLIAPQLGRGGRNSIFNDLLDDFVTLYQHLS